jgi:plasmid stabilization system protein ParE
MKILFTHSAYSDLEAIKEYYLEEGVPHIGEEFVLSIMSHVQTLKQHQDIGRLVQEFDNPNIRELIHAPFRVVYLREKGAVHIVRVWRSERILVLPDERA